MSALLELIKEAPPEDRKAAAEMLKPYFGEPAKDKPALPQLISLEEFQKKHKIKKAPDWLRTILLPQMPGVYGLNCGSGHPIRINDQVASDWLNKHVDEIDWNQPLP